MRIRPRGANAQSDACLRGKGHGFRKRFVYEYMGKFVRHFWKRAPTPPECREGYNRVW